MHMTDPSNEASAQAASGGDANERLAIVGRLRPGSRDRAREIIAAGPPYELNEAGFRRHSIFLAEETVVFVFEGPGIEALVSKLIGDPAASGSFSVWGPLLAGTPTLAQEEFFWEAG
jgi:hypothetical protein